MTTPDRCTDRQGWRTALVALALGLVVALPGTAPASTAQSSYPHASGAYAYDTAANAYDAPARLLSLKAATAAGQSPPAGPEAASWGRFVSGGADVVAAEGATAADRVVLFNGAPEDVQLGPGERTLNLPDLGNPKANCARNSGALRQEMGRGVPICDSAVNSSGELINSTGFLRAERYLLQDRGWTFDPKTTLWSPSVG